MRGYRGIRQFTAIVHSKRAKMRGYRGTKQFTAIIHSKKSKNKRSPSIHCNRSFQKEQKQGVTISSPQSLIPKRAKTRDRHQFIAIAHSKKSKNKRSQVVHCNRSFKKEQKQEITICDYSR
jgi:hypothetical protein